MLMPPLAAVSTGSDPNVTAGSRNNDPSVSSALAQDDLSNRSPLTSGQRTVRLVSSDRAVTPCRSATVR